MFRSKPHRIAAALVVVLSLLFSQLAMAAYVCPGQADAEAMAEMMAAGDCEGMDEMQPVLCHQYAMDAAQSNEVAKVPTPSLPMVVQVLLVPVGLDLLEAHAAPSWTSAEARPPPKPVFLSTLRLRV